jgi:hypothetical protein
MGWFMVCLYHILLSKQCYEINIAHFIDKVTEVQSDQRTFQWDEAGDSKGILNLLSLILTLIIHLHMTLCYTAYVLTMALTAKEAI